MAQRATTDPRGDWGQWTQWSHWSQSISLRDGLMFGAGILLGLASGRIAQPFAGQAIGSLRAMTGTDPFDALARDHQKVLALFEQIEATDNSQIARRNTMLLQIKRMLTAHALAEEDIV